MSKLQIRDVLIIGGGPAGLSAALYLGRSRWDALLVHSDRSMAKRETDAQNYLAPKSLQDVQKGRPARPQRAQRLNVPLRYVEPLSDARTKLVGFFSILLEPKAR